MTIEELIDALEKAEWSDRDLDAEISIAVRYHPYGPDHWIKSLEFPFSNAGYGVVQPMDRDGATPLPGNGWNAPEYTSSIDAALSLLARILPGWHWHVGSCPSDFLTHVEQPFTAELMGPITYAVIDREVGEEPIYDTASASAASAPLALLLAILHALEAKQVQP